VAVLPQNPSPVLAESTVLPHPTTIFFNLVCSRSARVVRVALRVFFFFQCCIRVFPELVRGGVMWLKTNALRPQGGFSTGRGFCWGGCHNSKHTHPRVVGPVSFFWPCPPTPPGTRLELYFPPKHPSRHLTLTPFTGPPLNFPLLSRHSMGKCAQPPDLFTGGLSADNTR